MHRPANVRMHMHTYARARIFVRGLRTHDGRRGEGTPVCAKGKSSSVCKRSVQAAKVCASRIHTGVCEHLSRCYRPIYREIRRRSRAHARPGELPRYYRRGTASVFRRRDGKARARKVVPERKDERDRARGRYV